MNKLEEIKLRRIGDVSVIDLNVWIMDEITGLANDFGSRIDDDLLKHTANRIKGVLLGKYRGWSVGEVHAAFQSGMANTTVGKVTVQRMLQWLRSAEKIRVINTVMVSEKENKKPAELKRIDEYDFGSFVLWCSQYNIYLSEVTGWDGYTKNLPESVYQLHDEWKQAKETGMLDALRIRLKKAIREKAV